ncbi:MAG TPA: hypothetical protein VG388_05230 [Solirubrobacteraceae bacterium]|nr:hypothetical protein [Solirubrobacteraceae bacterium]
MKARARSRAVRLMSALVVIILGLALPGSAPADGDPASDVLASQALFLPQDAATGFKPESQLESLLSAAARSGYPIRVAVIASSADMGSVTVLWRQPQTYARFLGQELAYAYHGALLVVMPSGSAVTQVAASGPTGPGSASSLPAPPAGQGLITVASTEVRRLAAASGHPLPAAVAAAAPKSGSGDPIAWLVLALGAVLIGLAWTVSLRLRPLSSPAERAEPTHRG